MVRRTRSSAALATLLLALVSTWAPVAAQEASLDPSASPEPSAFCASLTVDEVSEALGLEVFLTDDSVADCYWDSDFDAGIYTTLSANLDVGTIEDVAKVEFPDGESLEIADRNALYADESGVSLVYLEVGDGGLLSLYLEGDPAEGVDPRQALIDLAGLMGPRLAHVSGPTEGSPEPEPSFVGDPELESMLPATVGGAPADIESRSGEEIFAGGEPDDPDNTRFAELLDQAGANLEDASIALGLYSAADVSAGILAVRIKDADARTLQDPLIELFLGDQEGVERSTQDIAGRDVLVLTQVTDEGDEKRDYVLTSGDTTWFLDAPEALLEEIVGSLP